MPNISDLPHAALHVESLDFEKWYVVVHDFNVASDSSCTVVERPSAVEILADVAISVGNISGDANSVFHRHSSVSTLADDVSDHSSRSSAD